jgi:hypothetical protein
LERRAIAAHERELLAALRDQAAAGTPVDSVTVGHDGLGAVWLELGGWQLTLAGVTPRAAATVTRLGAGTAPLALVEAGRYGKAWWVAITDGADRLVLLAARAHLRSPRGGLAQVLELPQLVA